MNAIADQFFAAPLEEITQALVRHYTGQLEGEAIARIAANGQTVIEIPEDYEPRWNVDRNVEERILGADFLITYHGTSTVHEPRIRSSGIQPPRITGVNNFSSGDPNAVYVGQLTHWRPAMSSVKDHAFGATLKWGGKPLIVRAITPITHLRPCEEEAVEGNFGGPSYYMLEGFCKIDNGCKLVFPYPEDSRDAVDNYYETRTKGITFSEFNTYFSTIK